MNSQSSTRIFRNVSVTWSHHAPIIIIMIVTIIGFSSFLIWNANSYKTFEMEFHHTLIRFKYPSDFTVLGADSASGFNIDIGYTSHTTESSSYENDYFWIWAISRTINDNATREELLNKMNERMDTMIHNARFWNGTELSRNEIIVNESTGLHCIYQQKVPSHEYPTNNSVLNFYTEGYEWQIINMHSLSDTEHTRNWKRCFETIMRTLQITDTPYSDEAPFETFTLTEGKAQFSFEYTTDYSIDYFRFDDSYGIINANVFLRSSDGIENESEDYTLITINAENLQEWWGDLTLDGYFDEAITKYQDMSSYSWITDFSLLSRSKISIDGIDADQFISTYNDLEERNIQFKLFPQPTRLLEETRSTTGCYVVFLHDDLLWTISMESNVERYETDKPHFDHILESFRIPDY